MSPLGQDSLQPARVRPALGVRRDRLDVARAGGESVRDSVDRVLRVAVDPGSGAALVREEAADETGPGAGALQLAAEA